MGLGPTPSAYDLAPSNISRAKLYNTCARAAQKVEVSWVAARLHFRYSNARAWSRRGAEDGAVKDGL